ncbi:MAG: hypothetical protein GXC76_01900 [Rhodanobacteraceae bacterium]|jgi:hypothetical protein|nr:hypothetical protein [Rhodanobacteraceae bacterium]
MAKQRRNERRGEVGEAVGEPGYIDLHAMRERALRIKLLEAQIASATAEKASKHERAEAARAAKKEGSAARARKVDLLIIAALAELAGYLNGTDAENARALVKAAGSRGLSLEIDGSPIDERTVIARLAAAKNIVDHK